MNNSNIKSLICISLYNLFTEIILKPKQFSIYMNAEYKPTIEID